MTGETGLPAILASLRPTLWAGAYVFVSVEGPPPEVEVVALMREAEGSTLVLEQRIADDRALHYDVVLAAITLGVESSLEAVGLTAVVAGALARAGISCNVVAGFFHDHLFVPHNRASEAVAVLEALSATARDGAVSDDVSGAAIRGVTPDDHDRLMDLWRACGIRIPAGDSRRELATKLERDPDLFVLAEHSGQVVAAVMGSYDGRRGWIGRLCTLPDHRGAGLGTHLVRIIEARLLARGCPKANLLIEQDNAEVVAFYRSLGYATDDLIFMERWLA